MLDHVGEVFERLLRARMRSAVSLAGDLSPSQHGFRKGRSTIGAIKVVELVRVWLETHCLKLSTSKTEILVKAKEFSRNYEIWRKQMFYWGDKLVEVSQWNHRYHGLTSEVVDKAAKTVAALSGLMPNVAGPRAKKRRLLKAVAHSIMLYGAEVSAKALDIK